jgi:phosphatidylglycerol:prolipoprotein diacylglycerol transferase
MHPILFQIGFFSLHTYGVFMALGFLAGIWLTLRLNRQDGRPDEPVLDLAAWILVGSVAGARLLYVLVMPDEFRDKPWTALAVWNGGLVYYGGLAGGASAALWSIHRKRLPLWPLADCLAPGIALGQVFGRFGCFFNGCCYGRVSEWGLVFPAIGDGLKHLPVQLFEAAACLALSLFLAWFKPRRRFVGEVFWLYLSCYGALRFSLEFLRGDAERGLLLSPLLSPSQWISLAALGLAGWRLLSPGKRAVS